MNLPLLTTKRRRREPDGRNAIYFRPIRTLLKDGRPLDPTAIFNARTPDGATVPLCAIAETTAPRILIWPILPAHLPGGGARNRLIDHVTLDLRSGESHTTTYDHTGAVSHDRVPARLYPLDGIDGALWLIFTVAVGDLQKEPMAASLYLKAPSSDATRRVNEFTAFAQSLDTATIDIPHGANPATFVCYGVVVSDAKPKVVPLGVQQPMRQLLASLTADAIKPDAALMIAGCSMRLRTKHATVIASCPPGALTASGAMGFITEFTRAVT